MKSNLPDGRKKVLIASTNADWAGAPIHVLTLVSKLESEFDFSVVFGEDGPVRKALAQRGISNHIAPTLRSRINPVADIRCLLSLLELARAERPALLHAHSSKAGMIVRLTGWLLNIPCVYTVHGWGFGRGRTIVQSSVVRLIERALSIIPDTTYIFVSEADRQIGLSQLKIRPEQCVTVHNGVPDHGHRSRTDRSSTAIMVARVCHAKNHDSLLKAFQMCGAQFRLLLAGEGTDSPAFRKRALGYASDKHQMVDFLGVSDCIPALLEQAGVFVLSSRYEGLPLSIIEAMCAGLPIVATDVGGVHELVEDGVNGFLVPPDDHAALAKCLDHLQRNPELRIRMGAASRARYIAEFSDAKMASSVADVYRAVMGES